MRGKIEKLEMLRGCAALYIVITHVYIGQFPGRNSLAAVASRFGQAAVMGFFLLSGFVIYYSHHLHHDHSLSTYLARRLRRIYPVFLVALLVSYLVKVASGDLAVSLPQLVGNLFMLQDFSLGKPGVWIDPFCGNLPLWSLSYEWWFYMMFFPIYSYVPSRGQLPLVTIISLLGLLTYAAHPNQISLFLLYFILWWTGLEVARTYCQGIKPTLHTQRYSIVALGSLCILVTVVTLKFMPRPKLLTLGTHPLLEIQHFASCLVLLLIGLSWSSLAWRGFSLLFGIFSRFAPISYALYVFHFPLCFRPVYLAWIPSSLTRVIVSLGITFLLAYLAEFPMQRAVISLTRHRRSRRAV